MYTADTYYCDFPLIQGCKLFFCAARTADDTSELTKEIERFSVTSSLLSYLYAFGDSSNNPYPLVPSQHTSTANPSIELEPSTLNRSSNHTTMHHICDGEQEKTKHGSKNKSRTNQMLDHTVAILSHDIRINLAAH
jgi:hypothetical protein